MLPRFYYSVQQAYTCLALAIVLFTGSVNGNEDHSLAADPEFTAQQKQTRQDFSKNGPVQTYIKTYCADCHGDKKAKSGYNFQRDLRSPEKMTYRKNLNLAATFTLSEEMPPFDEDIQPTAEERAQFAEWIDQIKYLSPKDPGSFVIRRLTKTEFANTLHDLYGVDRSIVAELPDEVIGEGYLNSLSPFQSEQYLGIANQLVTRILAPPGEAPTETQKRLFGETPGPGEDPHPKTENTIEALARSAYRRPPSSQEVAVLMKVYDLARGEKLSHTESLRLVLKAIIVSPQFLFITPAAASQPGQEIVPLDNYQLASRLSYLLWSTIPDAELYNLAGQGKLQDPAILRQQTKRMLLDERSRALFDGFGAQWLGLLDIQTKTFDTEKFPLMTTEMRQAMQDEVRLFFQSIIRENQSIVRFIDSDYTFLNQTLARLYGLEKEVQGPEMRRVKLTDSRRGGLLGMPGILAVTSFPTRTSPVKRGVWVLEQILGQHVPSAPPDVPSLEKQKKEDITGLTLRQRNELHQSKASCANCHNILDPIGFGLENYDAIGNWREKDDGGPIDSSGKLPTGEEFKTPTELKTLIASRKKDLGRNVIEKLLAYALGRTLDGYDDVVVEKIMKKTSAEDYPLQTVIAEIVTSYPFTYTRVIEANHAKLHVK